MLREVVWRALVIITGLAHAACGTPEAHDLHRLSRVEIEASRALTERFAIAMTVRCGFIAGMPFDCAATGGGARLPISVKRARPGWDFWIEGRVVDTRPVVAHIDGLLADLGVSQIVTCGPALLRARADERIACKLSGGGAAFVDLTADGTTSYELALDAATAAVRGEPITPDREHELSRTSGALEQLAGDDEPDGEPEVTDGGAQPDPFTHTHSMVAP
ncbi:MAG: hypothetical protein JWO36_6026 [Myxococcales bacterium]|nr:hypothetical protein [Myxococcales bacterium]